MTPPGLTNGQPNDKFIFNRMLLVSVVFHVIALSVILFSPSFPTPKMTFGPVHTVRLISSSEYLIQSKSSPLDSSELRENILRDQSLIVRKQADMPQAFPVGRVEPAKRDTSSIERIIDDIRQRVSTSDIAPVLPKNQAGDKEIPSGMEVYYSGVWAKIKENWAMPQSLLPQENIEAIIYMKILKNGAVTDIYLEKRSGNRFFDDSAMRAVRKAAPFPPLPERIKSNHIEIGVRFHSQKMK